MYKPYIAMMPKHTLEEFLAVATHDELNQLWVEFITAMALDDYPPHIKIRRLITCGTGAESVLELCGKTPQQLHESMCERLNDNEQEQDRLSEVGND